MHRAWVMMIRCRSGFFTRLEHELQDLHREYPARFRKWMGLYGHYDSLMVVEAESLQAIHQAVGTIQSRGAAAIYSTITYVAVNPVFDNPARFDDNVRQICIGFVTEPGRQDDVRNQLESIADFDIADVVFGELDVMALFHTERGAIHTLRAAVQNIEFIQKTTTMLPHALLIGD